MAQKKSSERLVRDIKRNTRRKFSSEEKIRIVIDGLRGETSIAELCRREGIAQNLYYRWSKDFLESGKRRLDGDTKREANISEVQSLREGNDFYLVYNDNRCFIDRRQIEGHPSFHNRTIMLKYTHTFIL